MSKRNRVFAVILVAVLMLTAFMVPDNNAAGVGAALTAADLWMSAWAAYCASHGMANTFISGSSPATTSNPISSGDVTDLVDDLIDQYANYSNQSVTLENWAQALSSSVSVSASNGLDTILHVAAAEVQAFDAFADWLLGVQLGLTRTASGFTHNGGTFGSVSIISGFPNQPLDYYAGSSYKDSNVYYYSGGYKYNVFQRRASDAVVYVFFVGNVLYGVCQNYSNSSIGYHRTGSYNTISIQNYNSTYGVYVGTNNTQWSVTDTNIPTFATLDDALSQLVSGNARSKIDLGATDANAGVIGIPDVNDQDYAPDAISVPLNQPWDETYAGSEGLVDALTGIMEKVRSNTIALAGEGTDDPGGGSGSDDPDDFQALGLGDVFPFCLPFDLYDFFSCLAADPVAPRFQIPVNFPPLNYTYTFDVDLSSFDTVAAVLRKMELLGFCVALILVSRQKFLRG